jgi:phosphate transport system substrate-binding protein
MKVKLKVSPLLVLGLFVSALLQINGASGQTLSGAGSSAAAPIYRSWAAQYQIAGGPSLSYEPIGSSGGIKKIKAEQTGFGASDVAPSAEELKSSGLVLFPIAITGISPVVNLPKVDDGQLRLTGPVLARIFLGEITQWNDPAVAQLNAGLSLPALPIKVVVRSDGSGTTYNFADYLSKVNATWKTTYGAKTSFTWPSTFIGSKGSDGVVKSVKENIGAIGYVDYGYVKANRLLSVQMAGADGIYIQPSVASFRAAMQNSEWNSKGTFSSTLTNITGKGAWPITMGTFVLVPQITKKEEQTTAVLQFFIWAFMNGDSLVQQNNFVRLPDRMQSLAFKAIASVRNSSGKILKLNLK